MGKRAFILRRLLHTFLVLFAILAILFAVFRLMPGDPTAVLIDSQLSEADQKALLAQWGLDQPLPIQFWHYLRNLLTGDFGISFYYRQPVMQVLGGPIWNTLVLMGSSMGVAVVLGVLGGMFLGWRRGSKGEKWGVVVALLLRSIPIFWLGILLLMIFTYWLRLFPTGGIRTSGYEAISLWSVYCSWDFLHHLAIPFATALLYYVADPLLIMRTSMLEIKGEDFLEMAKAKGLKDYQVMKHCVRNAILPVITFVAVWSGFAFGGQVLLETVFSWPGMGREIVQAVTRHDYPVAQAAFFFMSFIVVFMNFIVDLLYGYLDPRIVYR
jgi:peptide/nickel transport system permease protein